MLKKGEIIHGDFEVLDELRSGERSTLYRAVQKSLGRNVVIKEISAGKQSGTLNEETEKLFSHEASILSSLSHPQIPPVYSHFRFGDSYCLVMDYLEGEPMVDYLDRKKLPLPVLEAIDLAAQLCDVLAYLHSRSPQVLFRDLKPENIMIQGGVPFLVDFGIARVIDGKPGQDSRCLGTPGYASPEHYTGLTDNRSDLFSLGRLLFLLLTGIKPDTYPPAALLDAPSRFNSVVPEELDHIVIKAAHPDPVERYQSASQLRTGIERVYLIKRSYESCRACGTPFLEGHYFCSACGALSPLPVNPPGEQCMEMAVKENTEIDALIASGKSPGAYSYGQSYYMAEYFARTLSFDSLITIEHNKVDELPHQLRVIKRVLKNMRGRALLADEVGLGKTIEAGLIMEELAARGLIRRVLAVVPSHLSEQWKEEMSDKFERNFTIFHSGVHDEEVLKAPHIIIGIDTASRNKKVSDLLIEERWDLVIVDEAHMARNRSTKRWRLINALRKSYILLLTATPLHNNLIELFNLITLLRPGHLRDEKSFIARYIDKKDPRKPKNIDELKTLLQEVMVRTRRSSALITFPQREAHTLGVEPTPSEKSLYDGVTGFVRTVALRKESPSMLPLMTLQSRLTSSPAAVAESLAHLRDGSACKLSDSEKERLTSFIEQARGITQPSKASVLHCLVRELGEKLLVFTDHVPTQTFLMEFLSGAAIEVALYSGSMPDRQASLRSFADKAQVLIVSKAGSEGLNLHHYSRTIVNYDLPWDPMRLEQRIGRLQRIGQKRKVIVYNLSLLGTIEDFMLEILDKKLKLFELAIGQVDLILGMYFEEKNFDELIWKMVMESKNDDVLRNELENHIGKTMAKGAEEAREIEQNNMFLSALDEGR